MKSWITASLPTKPESALKTGPISGTKKATKSHLVLHHAAKGHQDTNTLGYKVTHQGYMVYWIIISIGLVLGILDLFQVDLNEFFIPNLGLILGVLGAAASVFLMLMGRKFIVSDTTKSQR